LTEICLTKLNHLVIIYKHLCYEYFILQLNAFCYRNVILFMNYVSNL